MSSAHDAGAREWRVVPVYALTRGRTRSAGAELPIESLVSATELANTSGSELDVEYRQVLTTVHGPVSIVEISALLRVPAGVVRVLVSDLADAGYLRMHLPAPTDADGRPNAALLERLLDGLRAL